MKKVYSIILLSFIILNLWAQVQGGQRRYCYTDELYAAQVQHDSSLLLKRKQMDAVISKLSNKHAAPTRNEQAVTSPSIVIPVVIYIVYDSSYVNLSMAQIQSQMDQLNQNFAPCGYTFCYAKRNVTDTAYFVPQAGDSAGVFRIKSALSDSAPAGGDAQLKALSTLPSQNYLRIFVVGNILPEGVLGYTQMPGGNPATDGIVMRYDVFGSNNFCPGCHQFYPNYNLGAALTHEVGHFLDLYHTFQGACDTGVAGNALANCQVFGDQVCDTPPTDGSFGCPSPAPLSCDGITSELINNYMDYTDDPCKNAFTPGQNSRMNYAISAYHSVLTSTANLINTGVTCVQLGNAYASFFCANYNGCLNTPMTFESLASPGITYNWNFGDGTTATGDTVQHTYTATGQYPVTLSATDTQQGIHATTSTPVFINMCQPITCSLNKWDGNTGYLDFSSGMAVAVSHVNDDPITFSASLFYNYYFADNQGNPLFHYLPNVFIRPNFGPLLDTSFNVADSIDAASAQTFIPVTGVPGKFCVIENPELVDSNSTGASQYIEYSYIQAANGTVGVIPGKKSIVIPTPGAQFYTVTDIFASIPNCDGTKFWTITYLANGNFIVLEMDATDTVYVHQSISIPEINNLWQLIPSPDGRKIAMENYGSGSDSSFLYIINFDKSAGNITGYSVINRGLHPLVPYNFSLSGRFCFSPDSRFLYTTDVCCDQPNGNTGYIYQLDLTSPAPWVNKMPIYQFPREGGNGGQAPGVSMYPGPDQKIYVDMFDDNNSPFNYRAGVINNPDILENGLGSTGYNNNGPYVLPPVMPQNVNYGNFNFIGPINKTDAYGCHWQPGVPQPFSYLAKGCLNYQFYSDECWDAVWNFGDTNSGTADTSTLASPVHSFSAAGKYAVSLIMNGYTFTDTVVITAPAVQVAATPVSPCPVFLGNYSVANIQPFINYLWTVTNGTPASLQGQNNINVSWNKADTTGIITVLAVDTVTGCSSTATLNISYTITDSIAFNHLNAAICPGGSYMFNNQNLTAAGNYTDTITSDCSKSITTLTLRIDVPLAAWPGGTDTLNTTGNITLSGATPAGGVYSGTGVSGNTFNPAQANAGADTITYTYTDSNGCSATVSHIFVLLGINNISLDGQINLYPNPANNTIIAQSALFTQAPVQVSLYDVTGRQVTVPLYREGDKATFNIAGIASGVYWFRFTLNNREAVKRFVKMP